MDRRLQRKNHAISSVGFLLLFGGKPARLSRSATTHTLFDSKRGSMALDNPKSIGVNSKTEDSGHRASL
ncbi:hypothetical protein DdX_02113 [Ditylenchus destructor]|uniref:Uncharacterized protein n=1 Tax=Ditylenchus destructor TaxID=166010 RepID=A0AAD4NGR0_9BILA|nr:hypothetical protein DdX_02113 [Ditylenchus destructor]